MRMGTATVVLVVMACGDGPNSGVTLTGPQLTTFTNPGPNDDGPNDDTAPTPTDTGVEPTITGETTTPVGPTTGQPITTSTTSSDTGTSESGDVSTGPVGDPSPVVIDFDEWGQSQPVITDQYADAIFASEDNCAAIAAVGAALANTSSPNVLWLSSKSDASCLSYADLTIDFPSPAYDLAFNAALVESTGLAGRVRIFQLGVETALVDIIGVGDTATPVPVDLGLYPGITRIEIVDTELGDVPGGVKYDDFAFTVYL